MSVEDVGACELVEVKELVLANDAVNWGVWFMADESRAIGEWDRDFISESLLFVGDKWLWGGGWAKTGAWDIIDIFKSEESDKESAWVLGGSTFTGAGEYCRAGT